ncbi:cartilage acidic protein 1-like [Saccostrea echinata]|uniref:cartilage acidic protein 1-like n=1 Tax=Saccostrea echinata TaxID=191078 RepID=UPI002A82B47C|nr:cartilage acidic protein 1-like [Saccostrea echinata]
MYIRTEMEKIITAVTLTFSITFLSLYMDSINAAQVQNEGMFKRTKWLKGLDTSQLNYGVAVSDVDNDGSLEWIVAGFSGPNFVLKYNATTKRLVNLAKQDQRFSAIGDVGGQAIGVCACDIDGDGREEIYFLNTNNAYAGRADYGDSLFKWRNGRYVNLYSDPVNSRMDAKSFAGRSVACIDRLGTGKYSIIIATYSQGGTGNFALVEMDENHPSNNVRSGNIVLKNVASIANINKATGGRGLVVGPILGNNGKSDIFFGNEGNPWMGNPGDNFLFKNLGNGSFEDVAEQAEIQDKYNNARGISLGDFNRDGLLDIAYGNWAGPHRLFMQYKSAKGMRKFKNVATGDYAVPTKIRTVIAADFDNNGDTDIFMNNICSHRNPNDREPNKLFTVVPNPSNNSNDPVIRKIDIGQAKEPRGFGTGAAVTDMDGDGLLDLLVSHGESKTQPLQVYKVNRQLARNATGRKNNWVRVFPRTKYGAPARGAHVKLTTRSGRVYSSVIDGGSGYLCQMEPIAHFGIGEDKPQRLEVQYPDGVIVTVSLRKSDKNKIHFVDHPNKVHQ